MNRKARKAAQLEAELIRLTSLVRARRKQLAELETCPNKSCECRLLWQDRMEKQLATQVRKIRKHVRNGGPKHRPAVPPKARRLKPA